MTYNQRANDRGRGGGLHSVSGVDAGKGYVNLHSRNSLARHEKESFTFSSILVYRTAPFKLCIHAREEEREVTDTRRHKRCCEIDAEVKRTSHRSLTHSLSTDYRFNQSCAFSSDEILINGARKEGRESLSFARTDASSKAATRRKCSSAIQCHMHRLLQR